ncbi:MAG: hypothetical protein U1G07_00830 [Verrucomicrobiota bacterium]
MVAVTLSASAAPVIAPLRQSQQFTVVDARSSALLLPGQLRSDSGQELIRLDVDALLLSAERIKEALLSDLHFSTEGAGRIRLFLYPARKGDELIRMISSYSPGEWEYRVEIPDQIEAMKLVRGVIHAVLLEIANRGQGPRSAELPLWLVEGLTLHLMSTVQRDLVVGSVPLGSMLRIVRETPRTLPNGNPVSPLDSLRGTRQVLRANRPLSFSELAYPPAALLTGAQLRTYQSSAHLFVYELLQSKNGAASFVRMLRELPGCWNWETAFLRGFSPQFARMLDVEKIWSVDVLAFTARDPSQVWSRVACLERLDEILSVPAQVRVVSDMLPQRATLTIQQVISHWTLSAQAPLLRQKVALLEVLRFHAPADLAELMDKYRVALAAYLQKRDSASRGPETRMQTPLNTSLVIQDAVKELQRLDKQREELRPEKALSVNSPINH